jgi:PAS domain S-box-containing protein
LIFFRRERKMKNGYVPRGGRRIAGTSADGHGPDSTETGSDLEEGHPIRHPVNGHPGSTQSPPTTNSIEKIERKHRLEDTDHLQESARQSISALEESERRYRDLIENAPVGVYITTVSGEIRYINKALLRTLGYETLEEMRGQGAQSTYQRADDREKLIQTILRDGRVDAYEVAVVTKAGDVVNVLLNATMKDGLLSGMIVDITARKRAEEALKTNERQYRSLIECAPFPAVISRLSDNAILYSNRRAADLFKVSQRGEVDRNALDYYDNPMERTVLTQQLMKTGFVKDQYVRLKDEHGNRFWALLSATLLDFDNGQAVYVALNDVTELKSVEDKLQESEIRYQSLFESSSDAILLLNNRGMCTDCNEKASKIFGCSKDTIIGEFPYRFSPAFQPDGAHSKHKAMELGRLTLAGQPQFFEWMLLRRNGTIFDAEVRLTSAHLGAETHILGIIRDVSARKKAEEKLRESEEKYSSLIENSPMAVLQTDVEGNILFVNYTFLKMFEYDSLDATRGLNFGKLAIGEWWQTLLREVRKAGYAKELEGEILSKTGRTLIVRGAVILHGDTLIWKLADITEQKIMEEDVQTRSASAWETNAALKVLLANIEEDKREIEEKILNNVNDLVLPYLENIKGTHLTPRQEMLIETIQTNLGEIVSPFLKSVRAVYARFTPAELRVADFVRRGKASKEIADTLGVSESAINLHRQHIRNKLGLKNEKTNLRTYLLSLIE